MAMTRTKPSLGVSSLSLLFSGLVGLLYLVIDFLTEKKIEISVIQMKYSSTAKKELQPHINSAFMEAFGVEADDFDPSYGSLRFETVVI